MEPFLGILQQGKSLNDYDYLVAARTTLFDEIAWWSNALKVAREAQN
jgi:hypothetical protein